MLSIPRTGIKRSVNEHNVELEACCDWLEASALFHGEDVAGSDVVDLLHENEFYADQDFAWEMIQDVFARIGNRRRLLGHGYPFVVENALRVRGLDIWQAFPAYAFCLLLSLTKSYPEWARSFGRNHAPQGSLFERLAAESMSHSLVGWKIHPTGWAPTANRRLKALAEELASLLGEATGDISRWIGEAAKDGGLDILCYRPFPDNRVGAPVYLMQCASGNDWVDKLKSPDPDVWTKIITFAARPSKAFAMPFALETADFIRHCGVVNGLLMDRHRLLAPGLGNRDWLSPQLNVDLINWITPRIAQLPAADSD